MESGIGFRFNGVFGLGGTTNEGAGRVSPSILVAVTVTVLDVLTFQFDTVKVVAAVIPSRMRLVPCTS